MTNDYTVSIVWKGASSKIKLKDGEIAGVIVGVAAGVALLIRVFLLPYLYRKLVLGDWQLQWWHILQDPLLLRLGEIPPRPEGVSDVQDYYRGHLTKEELEAKQAQEGNSDDVEKHPNVLSSAEKNSSSSDVVASNSQMAPRLGNSLWSMYADLHWGPGIHRLSCSTGPREPSSMVSRKMLLVPRVRAIFLLVTSKKCMLVPKITTTRQSMRTRSCRL